MLLVCFVLLMFFPAFAVWDLICRHLFEEGILERDLSAGMKNPCLLKVFWNIEKGNKASLRLTMDLYKE